ncbi:MAG TPA: ABC transporter ATP-binding protein [Tepidisphaeraceae bacterium]|jgi:ABC-2 type transport system ATP-binding protein
MSDVPLDLVAATKRYRDKIVLDELNLTVPAGSVVGLLGKNGSGKTTLIKAALGLVKLDLGSARVFDQPAWHMDADAKSRLGYVPQVVNLYAWMRVRQTIEYIAAFYPRWNWSLIDRLLTEWELNPRERVGTLSVGQLQKLGILVALGHEPDLLVLDEPAASLDPIARRDFLKALLEIAADGNRTVLFSTHITSDLERVADRVAILRNGKITYHGELDELKENVKRLHVTAKNPLTGSFNVPGAVRLRVEGNEALVSVKDASGEVIDRIRADYEASVTVEDLNLEEIFLEMHYD